MSRNAHDVRRVSVEATSGREPSRAPPGRDLAFESSVRIKTRDANPTDPEVPAAKRVRRASTFRSQLLIAAVAIVLFGLGMVLLYETGRQLTRPSSQTVSEPAAATPIKSASSAR